jgi:uncharacterized protein YqgV (UPF0045/DUF77 family)
MSVVEDLRKVIQDLVAPDLKALAEKLNVMDRSIEHRLKAIETIAEARHNELLAKIETSNTIHTARYDTIMKALDIDKRLEKIEAKQTAQAVA